MFHVEQNILLLWAASTCLGAAQLAPAPETPQAPMQRMENSLTTNAPPALSLALATDNEETVSCIEHGMQELLLGDDIVAAQYFKEAMEKDEFCSPLAFIGLYLAQHNDPSVEPEKQTLAELEVILEKTEMTPPEAYYTSALLLLANRDLSGAQDEFSKRADKFRADIFSACWAIQLLHYRESGYDEQGNIRPLQQDALNRAAALYAKRSENPVVCYLRALIEESAPQVSEEALAAAKHAVELLPTHPTVHHLYGHLLYRSGHTKEAAQAFHSAWQLGQQQNKEMISLYARIYESVALWSASNEEAALFIRRELNKLPVSQDEMSSKNLFLLWESRTLPFRVLILRTECPSMMEINAATRTALPQGERGKDFYTKAILCLKDSISVRHYLNVNRKNDAIVAHRRAEASYKALVSMKNQFIRNRAALYTPCERVLQACDIALNVSRKELFPSTQDVWNANIQQSTSKASSLQLPPVVPTQNQ